MKWQILSLAVAVLFVVSQAGCGKPTQETGGGDADGHVEAGHDDHGHDHDAKGPNGGQLLELGNEEYHAELLHDDDTKQVTVFLLDGEVKSAVLAAADAVRINVSVTGTTGSYPLDAVDPVDGKASKFQTVNEVVIKAIDSDGEDVKRLLAVTINGKSYSAVIAGHDHDDHGHDEHGHDEHEGHEEDGHHEDEDHDEDDHEH